MEDKGFIRHYIEFTKKVCKHHNWKRDWSHGGCYMHLETSEFIEALRGKGDPEDELGDMLFMIFSMAAHNDLDIDVAIKRNIRKHERIIADERDDTRTEETIVPA